MNLKRCRELHRAMVDGSAREEDVRELLESLPDVFEAAEYDRRQWDAADRNSYIDEKW